MNGKPTCKPEWAKQALQVQDACNLSGVLHAWSRIASEMVHASIDTDGIRRHPVSVLFSDKVSDLCGRPGFLEYCHASDFCEAVLKETETDNSGEASTPDRTENPEDG